MNEQEKRLLFLHIDEIRTRIKELKTSTGGWYDLKNASEYTSLSVSTLKRGIQSGKLKVSRKQGKLMFRQDWLDRFLYFGHCKKLTFGQRIELHND